MNKEKIIELLGSYKERDARIKMINKEIKCNENKSDELRKDIGKINSSNMDGVVSGNSVREVSRTVEEEVIYLVDKDKNIKEKILKLEQEKIILEEIQEDINIRFSSLTEKENKIVVARYIENKEVELIGNTIYLNLITQTRDAKTVSRDLKKAISKMIKI